MPGRSVRRRQHKTLAWILSLPAARRDAKGARFLIDRQREANRRARSLSAPAVWGLAKDPQSRALAATLDPGGELQEELDRVCAEAVASQAGRTLVRGSRPLADRARLD